MTSAPAAAPTLSSMPPANPGLTAEGCQQARRDLDAGLSVSSILSPVHLRPSPGGSGCLWWTEDGEVCLDVSYRVWSPMALARILRGLRSAGSCFSTVPSTDAVLLDSAELPTAEGKEAPYLEPDEARSRLRLRAPRPDEVPLDGRESIVVEFHVFTPSDVLDVITWAENYQGCAIELSIAPATAEAASAPDASSPSRMPAPEPSAAEMTRLLHARRQVLVDEINERRGLIAAIDVLLSGTAEPEARTLPEGEPAPAAAPPADVSASTHPTWQFLTAPRKACLQLEAWLMEDWRYVQDVITRLITSGYSPPGLSHDRRKDTRRNLQAAFGPRLQVQGEGATRRFRVLPPQLAQEKAASAPEEVSMPEPEVPVLDAAPEVDLEPAVVPPARTITYEEARLAVRGMEGWLADWRAPREIRARLGGGRFPAKNQQDALYKQVLLRVFRDRLERNGARGDEARVRVRPAEPGVQVAEPVPAEVPVEVPAEVTPAQALYVEEAPGENEVQRGRPPLGPSNRGPSISGPPATLPDAAAELRGVRSGKLTLARRKRQSVEEALAAGAVQIKVVPAVGTPEFRELVRQQEAAREAEAREVPDGEDE